MKAIVRNPELYLALLVEDHANNARLKVNATAQAILDRWADFSPVIASDGCVEFSLDKSKARSMASNGDETYDLSMLKEELGEIEALIEEHGEP